MLENKIFVVVYIRRIKLLLLYLSFIDDEKEKSKFEILYYEYRERMFYAALEVVKNNEDAEDAVHNAFVGIANNMKSIGEIYSNATLSYCIKSAKNSAINILKKNKKTVTVEYSDNLKISDNDFFNKIFEKASYEKVVEAILKLGDIYKIPLYCYYVEDMKIKDIAAQLNISRSAVDMRIHRGKAELLKLLGENYLDE